MTFLALTRHFLAFFEKARLARRLLPRKFGKRAYLAIFHRLIEQLPSRKFLHEAVIPALAAEGRRRLLFVGTQSYNRPCFAACRDLGITVQSIDIDPGMALWGAPDGHIVGDVVDVGRHCPPESFDAVIFNGILGYGVDSRDHIVLVVRALAKVAAPGAILVVGWNPGFTEDAYDSPEIRSALAPAAVGPLSAHIEFAADGAILRHPQRYDVYRFT